MIILIALVILWTPYVVMRLLRGRHARILGPDRPQQVPAEPTVEAQTDVGSHDGPAWSALDDRQLTRLLTNSAPRTTSE